MNEHNALSRKSGRKIFWLLAAIVLLIGGLSAGWFWAAGRLDREFVGFAQKLETEGKVLKCGDRIVRGYPFRLGLFCNSVVYTDPVTGVAVVGNGLRSAAQLYRPGHVIAELEAPFDITVPGLAPLTLDWTNLKSSSRINTSGISRLSIVADSFSVSANDLGERDLLANFREWQLHLRTNPEIADDLDVSASATNWLIDDGGTGLVEPVEVSLATTIEQGYSSLRDGDDFLAVLRQRGGKMELADFTFQTESGGRVSLSGPLEIDRNGLLTGQLSIDLDDPVQLVSYAQTVFPPAGEALANFNEYLVAFGKKDGGKLTIRDFQLSLRQGRVFAGFFEIGQVPALF